MGSGKATRIVFLLGLDTVFFLLELIIGYMSHSLALIADSFHMLNDIFSLIVALWAVNVAKNRDADSRYTYGWKRAEILGALINAVFLIALCFSIMIEALQRLIQPQAIENPKLVLIVGCAGLTSNILGLVIFHDHGHSHSHGGEGEDTGHSHEHGHEDLENTGGHSHSHNRLDMYEAHTLSSEFVANPLTETAVDKLASEETHLLRRNANEAAGKKTKTRSLNMHGVWLHVLGDALGNLGVILAALFIWKTDFWWRYYADPLVSLIITVIIFSSALPLSRKTSRILLQATPSTVSTEEVENQILGVKGVVAVHDFHIWNLTESIFIASIHVEVDCELDDYAHSAYAIRNIFHSHGIHSATVQPEFTSKNIDSVARQRFSRIAGGSDGSASMDRDFTAQADPGTDPNSTGPTAGYGSATGTTNSRCLLDNEVACSTDNCLPK